MAFSTWTDLYNKMLDDLASNNLSYQSFSGPGGRQITYDHKTFMRVLEQVKTLANEESGSAVRRTYAKPVRSGW
jgi:hypothetical protein